MNSRSPRRTGILL